MRRQARALFLGLARAVTFSCQPSRFGMHSLMPRPCSFGRRARIPQRKRRRADEGRVGVVDGCTEDFSCSSPPNQHVAFGRRAWPFCLLPSTAAATCAIDRWLGICTPTAPSASSTQSHPCRRYISVHLQWVLSLVTFGMIKREKTNLIVLVQTFEQREKGEREQIGDKELWRADPRFGAKPRALLARAARTAQSSRPTPPTSSFSRPPPISTLRVQRVSPPATTSFAPSHPPPHRTLSDARANSLMTLAC